jgi:hypothetical protein
MEGLLLPAALSPRNSRVPFPNQRCTAAKELSLKRFLRNLFAPRKKSASPRSSTPRDRRVHLNLDVLEDRMTPSITPNGNTLSINLNTSPEGQGGGYTVTLTEPSYPTGVKVIIQDSLGHLVEQWQGPSTGPQGITQIIGGGSIGGNDTWKVNALASGVSANIEEPSTNPSVVNVTQPSGSFDFIQGALSVDGNSLTLNIYDQHAFDTGQVYTVTGSNVTRTTAGGRLLQTTWGNLSSLNLYGAYYGSGRPNTYNVQNTIGWGATTTLTTGPTADTVNVLATSGQLTVHGEGRITANLGDHGSVQNITGTVVLDNPPSWTTVNVDDSADRIGRTVDMYGTWGWGYIGGLAGRSAFIEYKYADTSTVNLYTGTGGNIVNVWATGYNVTTNIVGNAYAYLDHVNVGFEGSVQSIFGQLNISNPPGWTVINVDDSADPNPQIASLGQSTFSSDWGTLSGLAPAHINYAYGDTYGLFIETNSISLVTVYTDGGVDTWLNGRYV